MSHLEDNPSFGETQAQAETTAGTEGQQSQCNSNEAILEHKPGHFHLPLAVLRPSSDQRDIQLKKDRLSDQFNNPDEVECTKLGLLNFISVFEYTLQHTDEARKTAQHVLEKDPYNLNALNNLAHINRTSGMESEAKRLEAKITTLQGKEGVSTCEPIAKALVARSMAEQAFALTYDVFDKDEDDEGTEQTEKLFNARKLYQTAFEIGNAAIDAREKMTWSFFKAFNSKRILSQYLYLSVHKYDGEVKEMITKNLDKSIAGFTEVLHQEPTPLYKAQALVYMRCVMSRTEYAVQQLHLHDIQMQITTFKEQVTTLLQKEGSVKHAIDLVKNNHRVLNTMALVLKSENVAEAEATIKVSLETESDPTKNWYAYLLKGELELEKYKRITKGHPQSKRDTGNIELLNSSISNLKSSLEGMKSSKIYTVLGEAIINLALSKSGPTQHTDEDMETETYEHLRQALDYFNEALKKDYGARNPRTHAFRGVCLKRLKEEKQAVESWKRAVELDRESTAYWGNIRSLLAMLLNQCTETSDLKSRQPVVAETATYLKVALSKYKTVCGKFIPKLIEQFPGEFLQAADYFKITNDFAMARRILEEVHHVSQTVTLPLHQEIEERRRRIEEEIEECQEALANVGIQEPERSEDEQTADSDVSKEGATLTGDVLDERLPATDEQRAFMPLQLQKAKNTQGFPYDFFVIHSAKDAEWVNYTLLAKLEGEEGLKGCIADRDFQLGKYVLDNITAAVKDSANVLIILTPDLVQSRWRKHEMKEALHAMVEVGKPVISIHWKDCEVPDELKKITYLDAREHFDWEHLLRDLSDENIE
ncbi:tetratricopeptide repeat protein 22-like [Branchiostoma lanceolatum]|uniref:tetratricopeptide repeat protein 22-like n=1 Tax=Branchiostoma lanceolatum TaxID=7740 RepID=UPI0034553889